MDQARTLEHFHQAERHVREGEIHIHNQRSIIATLEQDGLDSSQARALLHQFEDLQALFRADLDRLRDELAAPQ